MKKKVFFVTNGLPGGGAERVMSVVANYLDGREYDVSFIMLRKVEEAYELNTGIKRYYRDKKRSGDFLGEIKYIHEFEKKNPGAVFVSFFTYQSLYTILASIGTKVRVIVSERNDPEKTVSGKKMKVIRDLLYGCAKCNAVVFQTEGAKSYFNNKIQSKGSIILNPIRKNLPEHSKEKDSRRIVSVGRLNSQKNYTLLLEAFALFCQKYNDYKLEIYGKGEQEETLKKLAKTLGIEDRVIFEGFRNDVHEKIADATMFVMSSDYEGLSNALLEAMAMGLPCISTDSPPGGARMVIKNGQNGLLVPVGNKEKLMEAMDSIEANAEMAEKMGRNAAEMRDLLSEERICSQWEKLIKAVSVGLDEG